MASSYKKYMKYKKKYLDLKKNRTLKGGLLDINSTFSNVTSFGFEFEFSDILPFIGTVDKDNRSLILEPFGYDENSSDDTQNRSMKKINLPDIIVDNLVGEFVLTQDSYDILESDDAYAISLTSMNLMESLTNALDKNKDAFKLVHLEENLNYDVVKFNVDIGKNLTIGDTEFVCTFKTSNTNIFNINNCSQSIIDRLKQYLSSPVSNYIGYINIEYEHCSINGGKKECHIKQKWFDLLEIKLIETENIYILVESGIINDMNTMYDQLYCSPQITLGVPIKSVKNVILQLAKSALYSVNTDSKSHTESHTELSRRYEMLKDIETFTDYLVKSAVSRSPEIEQILDENRDVLLNYLFFYYSYANVNIMFNYQFKENDKFLTIHKYAKRYLPRQHFHEILNVTPNLLKCVRLIYDLNLDIIFSYRIQYLKSIISNPNKHMFVFDYDNILMPPLLKNFKVITTGQLLELHDYIDINFPKASKYRREFIIKILKHDMKMFFGEKNYNMDNITTFTTRIPYDGHHVLFEYRFLSSKILNFLETSGKINKFNENLTLNNIEFALNSYKSNYLFNNIPEEKQYQYNKLKIDNEQTQIKNSTIFLKNINKDMYQDMYGDVLEERTEPDRDIVQ